jgi:hypothetical protein
MKLKISRYRILGQPVDFHGCEEICDGFRSILRGWEIPRIRRDPDITAHVRFEKRYGRYRWNAPWVPRARCAGRRGTRHANDAVCDFHYEFIDWCVMAMPESFYIHMAAARIGGNAVLFPALHKAGKSTLSLHLAKRGHRLIGDDVVAIDANTLETVALGILPRVRLPLPVNRGDPDYAAFVTERPGIEGEGWRYVGLDGDEIAPFGERTRAGAVVLLERTSEGAATLEPATKGEALRALIDRNFAIADRPGHVFDRLHELTLGTQSLRLKYSCPGEAADLLRRHFGKAGRMAA